MATVYRRLKWGSSLLRWGANYLAWRFDVVEDVVTPPSGGGGGYCRSWRHCEIHGWDDDRRHDGRKRVRKPVPADATRNAIAARARYLRRTAATAPEAKRPDPVPAVVPKAATTPSVAEIARWFIGAPVEPAAPVAQVPPPVVAKSVSPAERAAIIAERRRLRQERQRQKAAQRALDLAASAELQRQKDEHRAQVIAARLRRREELQRQRDDADVLVLLLTLPTIAPMQNVPPDDEDVLVLLAA